MTGILSNLRTGAFDVPPQEILTRDSVTISVDAVVYYQVQTGETKCTVMHFPCLGFEPSECSL